MPRILYHTATGSLHPYPRQDDEPVVGLDPSFRSLNLIQESPRDHDPATERLEPTETIDLEAATVIRGWRLVTLPSPPRLESDWLGFAGWLYGFTPMAEAMQAARESREPQGEPATTGLPAAMDEARLRENYTPFAVSWATFLAASGLPADACSQIVERAQVCRLPAEFIEALRPSLP